MDETLLAALAKAAGLDKALADFPEDVAAAAAQARGTAGAIHSPTDPAAEPWPPLRPGIGLTRDHDAGDPGAGDPGARRPGAGA